MAKRKTTTVVEEDAPETPPSEVNYVEDIQGKSIKDIITDEPKVTKVEEKAGTPEDDPGNPPPPPEDTSEEIEFDPEQLKKEAKEEAKAELVKALQGDSKQETQENLDAYEQFRQKFESDNGKQPTWTDVARFIKEQTIQDIKLEEQTRLADIEKARVESASAEQADIDKFNSELEDGLNDLYRSNKLPKIKDANNPKDPGVIERNALFQTMATVNTDRVSKGLAPIRDIVRIQSIYHKSTNRQPAGANAPIGNGQASTTSADDQEINYFRDVHNKSWRDLFRGK